MRSDGSAFAVGDNEQGQCNVAWTGRANEILTGRHRQRQILCMSYTASFLDLHSLQLQRQPAHT